MTERCTDQEMAWREHISRAVENETLMQRFEIMTNNRRPPLPHDADFQAVWDWAELNRKWLVAYRLWVTMRYGWHRAPGWLLEETKRDRSAA